VSPTEGDAATRAEAPVAPILEIRDISKRFAATQALEAVSLTLHAGEVHALLGENGAGKSTLIKIMTGVYQPDRGEILLSGRPIAIGSAAEAQRHGIAAIYQEPLLFPDLNVAENIFISHQGRGAVTNWRQMFREAEEILAALGVALDVRSPARGLTLAAQQSVEIAKAISLNVRVLIMDEPTASLSAHEVMQLFKLVKDLRDKGVAILFVSHRMEEVFEIADKVTVFRDGRLISTRPRAEVTPRRAIADMVGREIGLLQPRAPVKQGDLVLSVNGLGREGVFREMKRRRFYEKPSEQQAREKGEAVRRFRKAARKQAIRDGLIAAPKPKPRFDAQGKPIPPRPGAGPRRSRSL